MRNVTKNETTHFPRGQMGNAAASWSSSVQFTIGGARTNALCNAEPNVVVDDVRVYGSILTPTQLDNRVHKLMVRVKQPGMTARARRSYLAASDKFTVSDK